MHFSIRGVKCVIGMSRSSATLVRFCREGACPAPNPRTKTGIKLPMTKTLNRTPDGLPAETAAGIRAADRKAPEIEFGAAGTRRLIDVGGKLPGVLA